MILTALGHKDHLGWFSTLHEFDAASKAKDEDEIAYNAKGCPIAEEETMKKRWYAVGSVILALICLAALVFEGDNLSLRVIRIGGVLEIPAPLAVGLGVVMLLGLAVMWWREADQSAGSPSDDAPSSTR
jgi:hypothetical protein